MGATGSISRTADSDESCLATQGRNLSSGVPLETQETEAIQVNPIYLRSDREDPQSGNFGSAWTDVRTELPIGPIHFR